MEELLISLGFVQDTTSTIALESNVFGNKTCVLDNNENTSLYTYIYASYPPNYPRNKAIVITKITEGSYGINKEQMQFRINSLEDLSIILKSII
jgi:hypothetical protein